MDKSDLRRFESKVDRSGGPDACHWWRGFAHGSSARFRYGIFWLDGKNAKAHRVAWELSNGIIPEGMVVRHLCDRPLCVNARHLAAGSQLDNMRDRLNRGAGYARGTGHHNAKLDPSKIRLAVELRNSGVIWREIAKTIGVSQSAIERAVRHVTWKHAQEMVESPVNTSVPLPGLD